MLSSGHLSHQTHSRVAPTQFRVQNFVLRCGHGKALFVYRETHSNVIRIVNFINLDRTFIVILSSHISLCSFSKSYFFVQFFLVKYVEIGVYRCLINLVLCMRDIVNKIYRLRLVMFKSQYFLSLLSKRSNFFLFFYFFIFVALL